MVRVAGRMRRMATGLPVEGSPPGCRRTRSWRTPWSRPGSSVCGTRRTSAPAIRPLLADEGIEILRWKELSEDEQHELQQLFRERIYPVLTPLVVDPAHPFPYISGLSLSLAVMIAEPETGATMFARVKVPPLLPRFLSVAPVPVRAAGRRDRRAPAGAVRRPGHPGAPRVPGDQEPRPGDRRGRHRRPHAVAGAGTAAPPLRARGAAGGRGVDVGRRPGAAGHRAGRGPARGVPPARPARPDRAERDRRPEHPAAEVPAVRAARVGAAAGQRRVHHAGPSATCWCTTRTTRSPPRWSG